MRFAVDSNILIYAIDRATPAKHAIAKDILSRAPVLDMILAAQVLGEFLTVIRRKFPEHFPAAIEQAKRWAVLYPPAATTPEHIIAAADLSLRHDLQFWDSAIWSVAVSRQATVFLSEDMQDGLSLGGMSALNPFNPVNNARLETVLDPD